jgi:hypothetical protein
VVLTRHLVDDRYQPVMHRAVQDLAPPLGALDEVVDHQVDAVMLVLIVYVDSILLSNTERKARRTIHPPLKRRGLSGPFL